MLESHQLLSALCGIRTFSYERNPLHDAGVTSAFRPFVGFGLVRTATVGSVRLVSPVPFGLLGDSDAGCWRFLRKRGGSHQCLSALCGIRTAFKSMAQPHPVGVTSAFRPSGGIGLVTVAGPETYSNVSPVPFGPLWDSDPVWAHGPTCACRGHQCLSALCGIRT